jgi:polysaccharide biosynthesis PFTS motif protein
MKDFYHCGQAYSAYNKVITKCERTLNNAMDTVFLNISKKDYVERIIQALMKETRIPFIQLCRKNIDEGHVMIPDSEQKLILNGVQINQSTGEFKISLRLFIKCFVHYFYDSFRLLFFNISGLFISNKIFDKPTILFFGISFKQIKSNESDESFVDFCRNGPISPLSQAEKLVIQDSDIKGTVSNSNFVYDKKPIEKLLHDSDLRPSARFNMLLLQIKYFFMLLLEIIKRPLTILIARDVASYAAIKVLDKKNKISHVLITNSFVYEQPLWMRLDAQRQLKVHMVLYSQNDKLAEFKYDKLKVDFMIMNKVKADEYWVWTEGRKKEIQEYKKDLNVNVVGPILWYLPEQRDINDNSQEINIAVFDVLPLLPEKRSSHGVIRNQYTTENMLGFINDIVDVIDVLKSRSSKRVNLYIKHKRAYEQIHDYNYTNRVQELIESGRIINVENNINLYSFLNKCDLTINSPYTSVAYISNSLKKDAIYYDPANEINPNYEELPYIKFVSGRNELENSVHGKFSSVN